MSILLYALPVLMNIYITEENGACMCNGIDLLERESEGKILRKLLKTIPGSSFHRNLYSRVTENTES
jgi:hypothetical protein